MRPVDVTGSVTTLSDAFPSEPGLAALRGGSGIGPGGSGQADRAGRIGPGGSGQADRAGRIGPGGSGRADRARRIGQGESGMRRHRETRGALRSRTRPPGYRSRSASLPGRVRLRLCMPEGVLDMVRFGSEHPGRVCEHWWRTVEERTEQWVLSQVPRGARALRIGVDSRSLEVLLAYTPASAHG